MKTKQYMAPVIRISDITLNCNISINSIDGGDTGIGYGGGADPGTGRGKNRDGDDFNEGLLKQTEGNDEKSAYSIW